MAKKVPSPAPRRPFVEHTVFLETPFERRFQEILAYAWHHHSWHLIAAVPGSGKSLGVDDLLERSGAYKDAIGNTYLPILVVRSPKNLKTESALGLELASNFGVIPKRSWSWLRPWLVGEIVRANVGLIIIDDAQDLSLAHLTYLKELSDNLAAFPHRSKIGLCLVTATDGEVFPLKETLKRPELLWKQFRWRMDRERPYCMVPGHTEEEIYEILGNFEKLYKEQFPDLNLRQWAHSIFGWLTHQILVPQSTKRVAMNNLTNFVMISLKMAAAAGASDVDEATLETVANLMTLRRDEVIEIDELPPEEEPPPEAPPPEEEPPIEG